MEKTTFLVCLPRDVMSKTVPAMKTTVGMVHVTILKGKRKKHLYILTAFLVTFQDCRPLFK